MDLCQPGEAEGIHEGCSCLRLLYVLCPVGCCACFYSKTGEMNLASQAGPSIFPCAELLQPLGPSMGQVSLQKVERTLPSLDRAPVICSLEGCTSAILCEDSQYLSEGFRERERANLVFSSRIGVWFSINASQRLTFPWVVVLHSHFWSLRDSHYEYLSRAYYVSGLSAIISDIPPSF